MVRFGRAMFALRFPMAAVLPVWVLLGFALFGGGSAGGLLAAVLVAPLVAGAEVALSALFSVRAGVRRARALEPRDAALLALFQLAVIGAGCFTAASAWFGLAAVALALVGLWLGGRRLAADVRIEAQRLLGAPSSAAARAPIDMGEVVVIPSTKR